MRIKDVLRSSSKFNRNETEEDNSSQNYNDDIFRNELMKNIRQCSTDDSGSNEDYSGSKRDRNRYRIKNNNHHTRNEQSGIRLLYYIIYIIILYYYIDFAT